MLSAKIHAGCLQCAAALLTLAIVGCASTATVAPHQYMPNRDREYPVGIVAASFAPALDLPLRLRGTGGSALSGAGEGVLACSDALFQGGGGAHPGITGLAVLFCVTVGALVGGVAGAVSAEPADTASAARVRFEEYAKDLHPQRVLAEAAGNYLQRFPGMAGVPVEIAGPAAMDVLPAYLPGHHRDVGSLLELRILRFVFSGSGREDGPLCLRFTTRARKIDAAHGQVLDDMSASQAVGCLPLTDWLSDEGARISSALASAYRRAAEEIIDEFYLVYHPPVSASAATAAVPGYVLAPREPPPPAVFLDIALFPDRRDLLGFGGMHFRDLDSVRPRLTWEPMTRITALAAEKPGAFTDVSYELRLFRGAVVAKTVAPVELVHEVSGLAAPEYQLPDALEPCSWYFWTVRARFRLHDTWRTTEWGGAYHTAGGHFSPSSGRRNVGSAPGFLWPAHYLYYPVRTPAMDLQGDCWTG